MTRPYNRFRIPCAVTPVSRGVKIVSNPLKPTSTIVDVIPLTTQVVSKGSLSSQSVLVVPETKITVVATPIGHPGRTGPLNSTTYIKRASIVNENTLYSADAIQGTLDTDPKWRIKLISVGLDGSTTEKWAEGSKDFNKVWDLRVTYNYL